MSTDEVTEPPDSTKLPSGQALYFYGVARARAWRVGRVGLVEGEDVLRVRYRDIDALVRPTPYEVPPLNDVLLQAHQKVVDGVMRRGTVLPAPYGVVFRGRRQLIRMLQDEYLVLDEGLSLLDGHWELRLHILPVSAAEPNPDLGDVAMELYTELRAHARAAVPFAAGERRLLSAAFLVERDSWIEFMDRAEKLSRAHDDVTFDITGPWPAYDFVHVTV